MDEFTTKEQVEIDVRYKVLHSALEALFIKKGIAFIVDAKMGANYISFEPRINPFSFQGIAIDFQARRVEPQIMGPDGASFGIGGRFFEEFSIPNKEPDPDYFMVGGISSNEFSDKEFIGEIKDIFKKSNEELERSANMNVPLPSLETFTTWKTIDLGTYSTAAELEQAVKDAGCNMSIWVHDIFPNVAIAPRGTKIDLVKISIKKMGFEGRAGYRDVYSRAKELGLELVPAEVGPQLRLQYEGVDQSPYSVIVIGMEPLSEDKDKLTFIFEIETNEYEGRLLDVLYGNSYAENKDSLEWIFCKRSR